MKNHLIVIKQRLCNLKKTNTALLDVVDVQTMCPLPWTHTRIGTAGNLYPCCYSSLVIGKVQDLQTKNLFHGQDMQQLRDQMLRGERPSSCNYCWDRESHNQASYRQQRMSMHHKELLSDWIYDPKIRSLELKLSSTCNYKCRICDIPNSSLRITEEIKFADTQQTKQYLKQTQILEQNKWYDNIDKFLLSMQSAWPDLSNLDLVGGETLIAKNLPTVLDHIIDLGHADHISLQLTTNGSIFPKDLIARLSQFKFVDIAISIDNVEDRFEFERGGSWLNVVENIREFLSLDKTKFKSFAYCTVNIQNVLYLDDIVNWAKSKNIDLVFAMLEQPEYFSINYLTSRAKNLVIEKYTNTVHPELLPIVQQVMSIDCSDGQLFVAEMKKFDYRRTQNFLLTHKAIAEAMGFYL